MLTNFRGVADFTAPTWPLPEVPVQIHFEFYMGDLAGAEARLRSSAPPQPVTKTTATLGCS